MTRVQKTIHLPRPAEAVFAYVTTPGTWPQWHPSSRGVSGATDHSLEVGEQVREGFRVGWHRGRVVWTCRERAAPHRWVIEGEVEGGGRGTITYTLTPRDGGTAFERTFVYTMPTRLLTILDRLFIRRLMAAASDRALRRLKQVLEGD
jgi:uncharacterized protein YndB with AHSA1/START domain